MSVLRQSCSSDPFRARYREVINEIVLRIVRDRQSSTMVIAEFVLDPEDSARLVQVVKGDLARLGEHNFAGIG